ncbi:MAG: hypothetical protein CFE37_08075 [Alphaproteobacteria bacterium PA4]|nr:MAG: hypothetical protein CFE37_08075 [Alphaproteobacteria bacterium PA4]
MTKLSVRLAALAPLILAATSAPAARAQPSLPAAAVVALPVYTLPRKPSALLTDPAALAALARHVRQDTNVALADPALPPTQRALFEAAAIQAALLLGDYDTTLDLARQTAARAKDGASLPLAGLLTKALMAARDAGSDTAARQAAFATALRASLAPIPVALAGDRVRAQRASFAAFDPALVVRSFAAQLDPVYARRNGLELPLATELLGTGFAMQVLPVYRAVLIEAIDAYLATAGAPTASIWPERSFALPTGTGTPIAVAIWDNGFDPADFPDQRLDAAGCSTLAFDRKLAPASGDLLPVPGPWRGREAELITLHQGANDANRGLDTEAARQYRERFAGTPAKDLRAFIDAVAFGRRYVHGSRVATIAAAGNPAIRLQNIRMETEFSLDEDRMAAFPTAVRRAIDHMKGCGVRIANLSWGISRNSIEAAFIANGAEPDPARRRQKVERLYGIVADALRAGIASAPDILFVAAAGNDAADLDNDEAAPASLTLPNLITVGAVDAAGRATGFSRSGAAVAVHANGVNVAAALPDAPGATFSGTSAAAPYVTNLAAKLLALRPDLTTARLVALIRSSADARTPDGVSLVNPRQARQALSSVSLDP